MVAEGFIHHAGQSPLALDSMVNVHKEGFGKAQLHTEANSDSICGDNQRGPLIGLPYEMRLATQKIRKKVGSALGPGIRFLLKPGLPLFVIS